MFILSLIMKLIKVLGSETSPASLASAVVLGMFMGLNPFLSLQVLACLTILLFFKINVGACLFSFAMWKLITFLSASMLDSIGTSLLESEALLGLWAGLYNSVLYYTGFYSSIVMGGIVVSLVLAVPAYLGAMLFIKYYRRKIEPVVRNSKVVKAIKANKLYKLYKTFTSPLGGAE